MPLTKLALPVDKEGYSAKHGEDVLSVKLKGGASRFRLDVIGETHIVNVQWKTNRKGYSYFMAFYRTTIKRGSLPFEIDLLMDSDVVSTYTAHIVPGTLQLTSQSGDTYIFGATLEVVANAVDETADAILVAAGP